MRCSVESCDFYDLAKISERPLLFRAVDGGANASNPASRAVLRHLHSLFGGEKDLPEGFSCGISFGISDYVEDSKCVLPERSVLLLDENPRGGREFKPIFRQSSSGLFPLWSSAWWGVVIHPRLPARSVPRVARQIFADFWKNFLPNLEKQDLDGKVRLPYGCVIDPDARARRHEKKKLKSARRKVVRAEDLYSLHAWG